MRSLLVLALTFCSFAVFGAERNAVDSLLSVLPVGTHSGEGCSVNVSVADYPVRSVYVNMSKNDHSIFKLVNEDDEFLFREYRKEFIQTDYITIDDTRSSKLERIIRTIIVDQKRLYVVVEEAVTVNRERRSDVIECVVTIN